MKRSGTALLWPWCQDPPDYVRRRIEFLRPGSNCWEMWAMAGDTSMLRHGSGPPAARRDSRFTIVSSRWEARQVDHVSHTQPFGHFPQLRASGRKDTAQQRTPAEPFHSDLPALSAIPEPLKNPGQLRRVSFQSQLRARVAESGCPFSQPNTPAPDCRLPNSADARACRPGPSEGCRSGDPGAER